MSRYVLQQEFPYCKGCGHHHVARNLLTALESLGLNPLDIVLVTDIGCHGVVDRCFTTHTVHGLHGRSVALAAGIALALPASKKVIVFIGDGGATIGLQHILESARLNVDMTVVVHNNMLYGMTGGQPSGLTPPGFRTPIHPDGSSVPNHDLCMLARDAGAAFTARVLGSGDFSNTLLQAIQMVGFSIVEVLELCTSYGIKYNPQLHLKQIAEEKGYQTGTWIAEDRPILHLSTQKTCSLIDIEPIQVKYATNLDKPLRIILGGSAGEGVQSTAELLAEAAMSCGLQVTKKGSYPITVQRGFSSADIIFSPNTIHCHTFENPDAAIITSIDGLQHNLARLNSMKNGTIWIDSSLDIPDSSAEVIRMEFRERAGTQNAVLLAVITFIKHTNFIPIEALRQVLKKSPGRTIPTHLFG